ncbi:MAG: hypothetical protein JXO22_12130, partial [Phycisphaerae bacterium]|nr:hypothetical protein [Phycisphaerae bacterium]
MTPINTTNINAINDQVRAWATGDEHVRPVEIEHIEIAENALNALADHVRSHAAGKLVTLVVDRTPMKRGGDELKPLIEDML